MSSLLHILNSENVILIRFLRIFNPFESLTSMCACLKHASSEEEEFIQP